MSLQKAKLKGIRKAAKKMVKLLGSAFAFQSWKAGDKADDHDVDDAFDDIGGGLQKSTAVTGQRIADEVNANLQKIVEKKEERRQTLQTSGVKKKRDNVLLDNKMRRSLEDDVEMTESILNTEMWIKIFRERMAQRPKEAIPGHLIEKINISGVKVKSFTKREEQPEIEDDDDDEEEMERPSIFSGQLLDELWGYQQKKLQGSKQILHYVIVSDQIKPSKMWRPDVIVPHVAQIMTREFEDVEQVKLIVER